MLYIQVVCTYQTGNTSLTSFLLGFTLTLIFPVSALLSPIVFDICRDGPGACLQISLLNSIGSKRPSVFCLTKAPHISLVSHLCGLFNRRCLSVFKSSSRFLTSHWETRHLGNPHQDLSHHLISVIICSFIS